jgi:hypothetical protein
MLLALVLPAFAEDPPQGDIPRPIALLQLWGTLYDMDESAQADATGIGDPEDDPGIKIKRFRFGLQDSNGPLIYRLSLGISSPYDGYDTDASEHIEIVDAVMGYQLVPQFALQAGMAKVPFSRDQIMGAADLTFQERGLGSEHMVPDRSLGVVGIGMFGPARVQLGVFNSDDSIFGDDSPGKILVFRAEGAFGPRDTYAFWGGPGKGFSLGVGAGGMMIDDLSTRTFAAGGDLMVRAAGFSLLVDGAWEQVSPMNSEIAEPGVFETTTRLALTTQASYSIRIIEPSVRFTAYQDSALGKYGQLLAGVVLHGGINPAGYDRFRLGAGYVMRLEEAGIKNDTVRMWTQIRF